MLNTCILERVRLAVSFQIQGVGGDGEAIVTELSVGDHTFPVQVREAGLVLH